MLLCDVFLLARLLQTGLLGAELFSLLTELRLQGGDGFLQLLLAQLQLGDFLNLLLARLELLAPTAQLLTQTSMLRLRGQLLLHLLQAFGQLLALRLAIGKQHSAQFAGLPAVLGNRLLNQALLSGILLQALLGLLQALAGLLPVMVQRLQTQRWLAGGQLRQLRLGLL